MKISLAIIISAITVLLGFIFGKPYLWLPVSILLASIIELPTRNWVNSNKLGNMRNLSMAIKAILASIGLYATAGQIICIGIIFWWFIF